MELVHSTPADESDRASRDAGSIPVETAWIEADLNLIAATRVRFAAADGLYGWEAA
ncbi:hypothetical protein [Cryptosporangium aurantiacum]|uniref:Uncharacterized protein n=1 Tax=Cryptosporangium aurantiacum TaxID=134849 RepID=A0A1M7RJD1_9ACTN|nr:hypothetical protein [Cryptosporangium aurantiacum]SHN46455.1 hypothetical protein SAMN05443668_115144 [Cryptosporangium aurantiacum]